MKIENDSDPYTWFSECLGPEPPTPQDWMKDAGLEWFDEELLGQPEQPPCSQVPVDQDRDDDEDRTSCSSGGDDDDDGRPSYTAVESSAWLVQRDVRPAALPSMIPGTRCFSDGLRGIRRPYALDVADRGGLESVSRKPIDILILTIVTFTVLQTLRCCAWSSTGIKR